MIEHRLLSYASRIKKIGTLVMMTLENETSKKLSEVFNMYTSVEEGFIRTRIPVKEACLTGEPVARSQARRICNRLDEFKEIILDFDRVEVMGRGSRMNFSGDTRWHILRSHYVRSICFRKWNR